MPATPDPFRKCYECDRVYTTAEQLLAEHAELVEQINREASPNDPLMVAQTDPQEIYTCPHCAHDF